MISEFLLPLRALQTDADLVAGIVQLVMSFIEVSYKQYRSTKAVLDRHFSLLDKTYAHCCVLLACSFVALLALDVLNR